MKPIIFRGGLSNRIYLSTDYEMLGDRGMLACNSKMDITEALAAFNAEEEARKARKAEGERMLDYYEAPKGF